MAVPWSAWDNDQPSKRGPPGDGSGKGMRTTKNGWQKHPLCPLSLPILHQMRTLTVGGEDCRSIFPRQVLDIFPVQDHFFSNIYLRSHMELGGFQSHPGAVDVTSGAPTSSFLLAPEPAPRERHVTAGRSLGFSGGPPIPSQVQSHVTPAEDSLRTSEFRTSGPTWPPHRDSTKPPSLEVLSGCLRVYT